MPIAKSPRITEAEVQKAIRQGQPTHLNATNGKPAAAAKRPLDLNFPVEMIAQLDAWLAEYNESKEFGDRLTRTRYIIDAVAMRLKADTAAVKNPRRKK